MSQEPLNLVSRLQGKAQLDILVPPITLVSYPIATEPMETMTAMRCILQLRTWGGSSVLEAWRLKQPIWTSVSDYPAIYILSRIPIMPNDGVPISNCGGGARHDTYTERRLSKSGEYSLPRTPHHH